MARTMLAMAAMHRAALVVILLAVSSGVASAGAFIGLGIGTSPATTDRMEADSRSAKVLVGTRMGQISLEGGFGGFDVLFRDDRGNLREWGTAYLLSGALKASLPLGDGFEAFGRVGVQHTWVNSSGLDVQRGASGNGFLLGAGVEYKLKLGMPASIWIDYQFNKAELGGEFAPIHPSERMWTLGFSIGI